MVDKKVLYKDWIQFAEDDLLAAKLLLDTNNHLRGIVIFHSQQAAEKIIKACLIKHSIRFPKTHDLNSLLSLLEQEKFFSATLYDTIDIFEKYSVEVRYPDPEVFPTSEEAKEAISQAMFIVDFFKKILDE